MSQSASSGTQKGQAQRRQRFSRRHGFSSSKTDQPVYQDAPESVRVGLLSILHDELGKPPSWLRDIVCGILRTRPNADNWSEHPNIWNEVQSLLADAPWYKVYDLVEAVCDPLRQWREYEKYEGLANELLEEEGMGWRLAHGILEIRGDAALEDVVAHAETSLANAGYRVAVSELTEARRDLSRRPQPDLSGAVQHAMAALESAARHVGGDERKTLGAVIKANPGMIPSPVDQAVEKLWGFSSDQARHGKESRSLAWEETLLVVGTAAAVCSYLVAKKNAP